MIKQSQLFNYSAKLVNVHDGDTITVTADCGFHITVELKLRLNRINAPELSTAEGKIARDFLATQLPEDIMISTFKDPGDKYGRWLAEVWCDDVNVNDLMVTSGNAVPYGGGAK